MSNIVCTENRIGSMTPAAIDKVRRLENALRELPQIDIGTDHIIHNGMYARTVVIPAGAVVTGVTIRVPTIVIVSGHCLVSIGDDAVQVHGYKALSASANRKQACMAFEDTTWTMIFSTEALTIEEAEAEFTDEPELLMSRQDGAVNTINITGE